MTLLAHGAVGYADEALVLVVPALVLLVLTATWIRGVNARRASGERTSGSPPPPA